MPRYFKLLLNLYIPWPGEPREFICNVAPRGLMCGKIGPGYPHRAALVYVERWVKIDSKPIL